MKLNPHLSFGGACEAAFNFDAGCLGGDLEILVTWGESPRADPHRLNGTVRSCMPPTKFLRNFRRGAWRASKI